MQTKEQSLCFTGHRSEKLPKTREEVEQLKQGLLAEIDRAIEDGVDTFYFGACYGFDLLAAQMVLLKKKTVAINEAGQKPIKLIAVMPHEGQANAWCKEDRKQYFDCTLPYCDEVITLHTRFRQGCYHERNRYMVDRCSKMICYYNGGGGGTAYTVGYAKTNGLKITNLYKS